MGAYRLYCLDGADQFASAEWIEAADDAAAVEAAQDLRQGRKCELWKGDRLVARMDAGRRG